VDHRHHHLLSHHHLGRLGLELVGEPDAPVLRATTRGDIEHGSDTAPLRSGHGWREASSPVMHERRGR